jgi:uncharacterized protein involved in exopolysaccharide biosynthesis
MGSTRASPYAQAMSKALSIAILIVGLVLLAFGLNAGDSIASEAKEAVTGTPTDRSMILIVGGTLGIVVGGFSTFFRRRG